MCRLPFGEWQQWVGAHSQRCSRPRGGSTARFSFFARDENAGITWDSRVLDAYLAAPQKVVPGNLMPFSGINDEQQRADIIAYLVTLK